MWVIFLQTLPFFALVGLGFGAGKTGFFTPAATAALTKFVFYFALSAMLFRFASQLTFSELLDWPFIWAYLLGSGAVYLLATALALLRKRGIEEAAVEAQCATIGNTGFLGIPMLATILGPAAVPPIMIVLSIDMIVFSSLIVIIIKTARAGRFSFGILKTVTLGLMQNPMIVSITLGLLASALSLSFPKPFNEFVDILGAAATPCALFAIGASLAPKSAERLGVALWLSFAKLILHPLFVGMMAFDAFAVAPFQASVMVSAAALPVAGNVYMLAQHYGVAPQRVSTAILISTLLSIFTVAAVVAFVSRATV